MIGHSHLGIETGMDSNEVGPPTPDTWRRIMAYVYALFDDLEAKGIARPPFSLGGGTVLMLDYQHRLSKDIDLFAYDVQWLSLLSPRLNDHAAALARDYIEQANSVKIITAIGDIDFIVARDVLTIERATRDIAGRMFPVDPPAEILAKKLFYRAATLKPRDVFDMSAVIDLAPHVAREAAHAATPKRATLLRRLDELAKSDDALLLRDIIPYDSRLRHADDMVSKVRNFVAEATEPGA